MRITVDIPDELMAEALEAATRINGRLPEKERQPEPITLGDNDARAFIITWLTNIILQDMSYVAQRAVEDAAAAKQDLIRQLATPNDA